MRHAGVRKDDTSQGHERVAQSTYNNDDDINQYYYLIICEFASLLLRRCCVARVASQKTPNTGQNRIVRLSVRASVAKNTNGHTRNTVTHYTVPF